MEFHPVDMPYSWRSLSALKGDAAPAPRTIHDVRRVAVRSVATSELDGEILLGGFRTRLPVLDGLAYHPCTTSGIPGEARRQVDSALLDRLTEEQFLVRDLRDAFEGPAAPPPTSPDDRAMHRGRHHSRLVEETASDEARVLAELDACARSALLVDGLLHTSRIQIVFNLNVRTAWQETDVLEGRGFSMPDLRPQTGGLPIPFLALPGMLASGRRLPDAVAGATPDLVRSSGMDLSLEYLRAAFSAAADWYRADVLAAGRGAGLHAGLLDMLRGLSHGRHPDAEDVLRDFVGEAVHDRAMADRSQALARSVDAYLGHVELLDAIPGRKRPRLHGGPEDGTTEAETSSRMRST